MADGPRGHLQFLLFKTTTTFILSIDHTFDKPQRPSIIAIINRSIDQSIKKKNFLMRGRVVRSFVRFNPYIHLRSNLLTNCWREWPFIQTNLENNSYLLLLNSCASPARLRAASTHAQKGANFITSQATIFTRYSSIVFNHPSIHSSIHQSSTNQPTHQTTKQPDQATTSKAKNKFLFKNCQK